VIGDGAEVEGDIVAEEVTIGGRVKGTIHAKRVKLNGLANVEGNIFHRSLSIEENARFEGPSRREELLSMRRGFRSVSRKLRLASTPPRQWREMKSTTVLSKIRGVLPSDSAKNVDAHMSTASRDNGPNRAAV
jgi:Polymer-forming cytoskeletal